MIKVSKIIIIFTILHSFQTRLSKILQVKKDWIQQLSEMNTITEKKVGIFIQCL